MEILPISPRGVELAPFVSPIANADVGLGGGAVVGAEVGGSEMARLEGWRELIESLGTVLRILCEERERGGSNKNDSGIGECLRSGVELGVVDP